MIIKRKYLFLSVYFMTMLCLFFSVSDLCPIQGVLIKVKYFLIIFGLWDVLTHCSLNGCLRKNVLFVFAVYSCFCMLYGKIWITEIVIDETNYQFKTTMMMLLMIFLVYCEVEYFRCFELFMHVSFIAIVLFLVISYITNISESSFNPIYVIKFLFNDEARGRAHFGLGHWNYVGFYSYVELILSIFCFKHNSVMGRFKLVYRWAIVFVDYIVYLMIVSASSRGALLSIGLFGGILVMHECIMRIQPSSRILFRIGFLIVSIVFIIAGINTGLFSKIWAHSSRGFNISINMPIFHKYGDFWKGMGWVDNSALQDTVDAFGLGTSSLDMFYVYVYFTTGFIGCVFMSIVYGTIGVCNFVNYKRKDGWYIIALFLSLLFYLYWDIVLFTINLWPGLILVVILLHGMGTRNRGIIDERRGR